MSSVDVMEAAYDLYKVLHDHYPAIYILVDHDDHEASSWLELFWSDAIVRIHVFNKDGIRYGIGANNYDKHSLLARIEELVS